MIPAELHPIPVPSLHPGGWRGILLERPDMGEARLWSVTVRVGRGRAPTRRWFPDEANATAYAANQADEHSLPLLTIRRGPDDE